MIETPLSPVAEYSVEERQLLLRWAHQSIRARLEGRELDHRAPTAHLEEKRGAFTTLHTHGKLRGCIGFVEARYPLYRTIHETAQSAAFHDPRFPPVRINELPLLQIEISVMSPLKPIAPADVRVGVHGLMISKGGRAGLLLPQVATEWGWDRETFLTQTCHKAGLPGDAWQTGAEIEAFTAEVFGEDAPGSSLP